MKAVGALLSALVLGPLAAAQAPVVPGLAREHPLSEAQAGSVLIEELRCGACHGQRALPAPDLSEVGARVDPAYLARFLADPAGVQPGTKMPALLTDEPLEVAEALTHFLASRATSAREPDAVGDVAAGDVARGGELFHTVGCVACHGPRAAPAVPGTVALDHVPAKYDAQALAGFLFQPALVRASGRMPDLGLTRAESRAIASYLLEDRARPGAVLEPDPALARAGRGHYERLGCAACHPLEGVPVPPPAPALHALDPERGCLDPASTGTPRYALSADQRAALARALTEPPTLTDGERIDHTLTALNCVACHARDDHGGVLPALDPYFTTDEPELGNEARIPPQLTLAGAKLQPGWMRRVLLDGASVRAYMHARMPRFGEGNVGHLPDLFAAVDRVEPFPMREPEGDEERKAWREAGRQLLGNEGLACIACHDFNHKAGPGFRGLDLIDSPERLLPSWFARFLIDPQAQRPDIVMPQSWPGGVAAHQGILDGDTEAQINALWEFLRLGRSAGDPKGISNPPTRLTVTDTVRVYRGRSRVAGFRGIAVGFPGGWNLAFNARTGSLTALWRGDFVSVRWGGQGAGDFDPSARPIQLAQDVGFHRLPADDAPWPLHPVTTQEEPVDPDPLYPKSHGYRFRGYVLDERSIPTFRYASGDVAIEDRFDRVAGDVARLRRTLRFATPAPDLLHMRVLTGTIAAGEARTYAIEGLRVSLPERPAQLRPLEAGGQELLMTLDLPAGVTTLHLDYELLR